jgi:hypothetical protein
MSRRSRSSRHHGPRTRPAVSGAAPDRDGQADPAAPVDHAQRPDSGPAPVVRPGEPVPAAPIAAAVLDPTPDAAAQAGGTAASPAEDRPVQPGGAVTSPAESRPAQPDRAPRPDRPAQPFRAPDGGEHRPTCTTAQLRRFIKSRPWIPMHELRRRFGIAGDDDDVAPVRVGDRTLFIGLPSAEAQLMGELLGSGDVGYELSLDPVTPIVVGVYPMRPVPRG